MMRYYRTVWISLLLLFIIACSSRRNSNNSGVFATKVRYTNKDIADEEEKSSSVKDLDKSESVTGNAENKNKEEENVSLPVKMFPSLGLDDNVGIENALEEVFDDTTYEVILTENKEKRIVTNCRQFLSLPEHKFDVMASEAVWNSLIHKGIRCAALDWIKTARPAEKSYLGENWGSPVYFKKIPPFMAFTLVPEDKEKLKLAIDRCRPWDKYEKNLRILEKGEYVYEIKSKNWEGDLYIYALGDFDSDGVEDLLVRRDAWPVGGSLYAPSLFALSKGPLEKCFRVVKERHFP